MNFHYLLNNTDYIFCEISYEPPTGDGWDEPFYAESFSLRRAEIKGVDVTDLLSEHVVELIEKEAEKHFKSLKDDVENDQD